MDNYNQAVERNFRYMKAPASEWTAVPVKSMVETTSDTGKPVLMPEFDMPIGYTTAPSLFRSTGGPEANCELCGHPIKIVYWLQNHTRRWILMIGSECVTHFAEGESGQQRDERLRREHRRDLLVRLYAVMQDGHQRLLAMSCNQWESRSKLKNILRDLRHSLPNTHVSKLTDTGVTAWFNSAKRKRAYEVAAQIDPNFKVGA